jgi:hypothetical protein
VSRRCFGGLKLRRHARKESLLAFRRSSIARRRAARGVRVPEAGRLALLMPLKEQDELDAALPLIPENNHSY